MQINMFLTFVTILPLKIPANYRSSSQFLSVGLKVDVRVWLMQKYLFATVWLMQKYLFATVWYMQKVYGMVCIEKFENSISTAEYHSNSM
jgi:hypothetical protein